MSERLNQLGLQALLRQGYQPAEGITLGRITRQDRQRLTVLTEDGPVRAILSPKNRLAKKNKIRTQGFKGTKYLEIYLEKSGGAEGKESLWSLCVAS